MVTSPHMRLVPISLKTLDAEDHSGAALANLLGVEAPRHWPAPFNDADVRKWMRGRLGDSGIDGRWLSYYIVADVGDEETLVGNCGFKGPPDPSGAVEVGYSIVPDYHRKGIGTAALRGLVEIAFDDERVARVTAETPASFVASRGLLEKCGFVAVSERTDPTDGDLVLYAVERGEH
jgi:RimJ/RimL family protein N-acetyltransferase